MDVERTGSDRDTYDAVFEHPVARGLHQADVQSMLGRFADVSRERDGTVTFTRNGQMLSLPAVRGRGVVCDAEQLIAIRHFLQRAGANTMGAVADGVHLVIVIGDGAAAVYEAVLCGPVPLVLKPYDPHGFAGHLLYAHFEGCGDPQGHRRPECRTFYEAVARTLRGAERLLVAFGGGPGPRGAVNELLAELRLHHPELAGRVAGTVCVDAADPSGSPLLDAVREFYRRHERH